MTPQPNITQTLADRRPHAHVEGAAARFYLRSRRQAYPGRHPATASLNIACWNVRSLSVDNDCDSNSPRKSALIDLELARLTFDICALSETWLTGTGSIREGHYTFFWSGYRDGSRPRHGSGFAVRNSLLPCMETPDAVSPRLMTLRLKLSSGYLTVLSAYAPTLAASSEEKDAFYDQLSRSISLIRRGDRLALAGDFNARVGSDYTSWPDTLGAHGVGNLNENGQRLLELCSAFHLCYADTYFAGSMSSKVTWMHPRSRR